MARTPIAGRKFYPSTKLTDARQISLSPERFIRRRKGNFFVRQTVVLFAKIKTFCIKNFLCCLFPSLPGSGDALRRHVVRF